MKKILLKMMALILVFTSFYAVPASAAEEIKVYLNGNLLSFSEPKPQIVNNRTMVPLLQTADYLGLSYSWNPATQTSTYTKGNRVATHAIKTNTITVDGKQMVFDTPSMIINDYSVMPVLMLAAMTGAEADWDPKTRSVLITTATEQAAVTSVSGPAGTVQSGQTNLVTVVTNAIATQVKLVDNNNNTVAETGTYTDNGNNTRTFMMTWTPSSNAAAITTVTAYAGIGSAYNQSADATRNFSVMVAAVDPPAVINVVPDAFTVGLDEYVRLAIYTNDTTQSVQVTSSANSSAITGATYYNSGASRVFEVDVRMQKEGSIKLTATAYSENNVAGTQTKSTDITVKESKTMTIEDISVTPSTVSVGKKAKVTVETSTDITKVEILDRNDNVVASSRSYDDKDDDVLIWELSFTVDEEGTNRYYAYAYNKSGKETSDRFNVKSKEGSSSGSSSGYAKIYDIDTDESSYERGDTVDVTIETNSDVTEVRIYDDDGDQIKKITRYTKKSGDYIWSTTFKADTTGNRVRYYVRAYDEDGDYDEDSFEIKVTR